MNQMQIQRDRQPGFFTVDVEDYYHIIGVTGAPQADTWDCIPARVEVGLDRLFEMMERHRVRGTLFFLGYIARRFPKLVRRALDLGHEVASHGLYHQKVRGMSAASFFSEAQDSRFLLEDIGGKEVIGWRSAGFLMDHTMPWYFDILVEAGYRYDSSMIPNRLGHQRMMPGDISMGTISKLTGDIYEFPLSVVKIAGIRAGLFGGVYLRFCPGNLLGRMADRVLQKQPLMIYIHPREVDPGHPKLEMNLLRRFKTYGFVAGVAEKLEILLGKTEYITLSGYLSRVN